MGFLFKSFMYVLLFCGFLYALFGVTMADKTVAQHIEDVWTSPVVKEKRDLTRHGITDSVDSLQKFIKKHTNQWTSSR